MPTIMSGLLASTKLKNCFFFSLIDWKLTRTIFKGLLGLKVTDVDFSLRWTKCGFGCRVEVVRWQLAHFSFPYYFTIPNSEFRILNSEFQIPKFALRISEFGIVKYM